MMQIPRFEMERWQSVWENRVELNISESGVLPLTVRELVEDGGNRERLLDVRLGYPQSNGSDELRANIASFYPSARAENVLVTTGCAEANFLVTCSLVEPGCEVILMMPNYMQVSGAARGFGGSIKPFWLREELRWAFDPDELRRMVTPKTRLIAVCNPNNPTGAILEQRLMDEICAAAARVGAWVLADEVYRGAEFSGQLAPSFWGRYERVLCTAGLSKAFGLPGLRTGWVVGPAEYVDKLWSYKDYTTIGVTMLTDRLAAHALAPAQRERILGRTRGIILENYPIVRDWLARHAGALVHLPPAAGAIAYIRYAPGQTAGIKSAELAEALLEQKSVLIVPGTQFEMENHFRVGFGYDAEVLRRALERVDEVLFRAVEAASR